MYLSGFFNFFRVKWERVALGAAIVCSLFSHMQCVQKCLQLVHVISSVVVWYAHVLLIKSVSVTTKLIIN